MPRELIITDDVNLEAKDKKLLLFDSVYNISDSNIKGTFISVSDAKCKTKMKTGVYAILSVSDKVINNRLYSKDSLKKNVINSDWTKPYARPFLRNHDLYFDMPSGRIKKAWFVDHSNFEISKPDAQSELPENVLKYFKDNKCFDNGTGSTIVELSVTEDTYERIANGLDVTVSQSSYMGEAKCNVCGQDYFGIDCAHVAGRSYTIGEGDNATNKICYVECSDFEPVELSIVNNPANDSSILFVDNSSETSENNNSDKKNQEIQIKDDKIDNTLNKDKIETTENNINKNVENKDTTTETQKTEDAMFKDLLKETFSKVATDKFGEEVKETFNKLFDSLESEEQISNLKTFLDSLPVEKTVEEIEDKTEEGTEGEGEEPTPNTKNEDENSKNPKEEDSKKSEDLETVFETSKVKVANDTQLDKKVAAMLKNL